MGEAAVATPTAAPAAPAAPPAAAATPATEPQKSATPAPSAPKPTAKQTEAQRISEAAKLLATAGSAKQSGAPPTGDTSAADATPAETPDAEPKPPKPEDEEQPRDVTVAEWRKYKSLKSRLEKREEVIAAREKEYQLRDQAVAQANQRIAQFQQRERLLVTDPKAFWELVAKENGLDWVKEYEKFANAYIDTGKPDAQLQAALKRAETLEQRLARKEQEDQQRQVEMQRNGLAQQFLSIAATAAHPNTHFTLRQHGQDTVMQDAVTVATDLAKQLRRPATDAEVAKELDVRYGAYYDAIEAGRKPAAAQGAGNLAPGRSNESVAPQQGSVESVNAVAPKAPTTLTNGAAAVRTSSGRKMTEKEMIDAAAALLPDPPKPRGI